MVHNQMLVLTLANVPTILTVLIGILLKNGRLNDLTGYVRFLDARLTNLDNKLDTRFGLLLSKVVDVDNRLTRIESQLHR
jgi:hypothetical protein